jgi:hypothetical protein
MSGGVGGAGVSPAPTRSIPQPSAGQSTVAPLGKLYAVRDRREAASARGYEYLAICDHTPAVGAVCGLMADELRRQGEEIAAANEVLAAFRVLRGTECKILPGGRLDLDDQVLAELYWVRASGHGGQQMPRREMTGHVEAALRNPYGLPQPPHRHELQRPATARVTARSSRVAWPRRHRCRS